MTSRSEPNQHDRHSPASLFVGVTIAGVDELAAAGATALEHRVELREGSDERTDLPVDPIADGFEPPPFAIAARCPEVVSV